MRLRIFLTLSVAILLMGFTYAKTTDPKLKLNYVSYHSLDKNTKKEIDCLVDNIFFESGAEPHDGKIAVAFVTMNRVKSEGYPSSVCGVIKQKNNNVCQFSWYCQKKTTVKNVLTLSQESLYNYMRDIAMLVYFNHDKLKHEDPSKGALFYHADYVDPKWKNVKKTTKIGRHIFYRKKDENI